MANDKPLVVEYLKGNSLKAASELFTKYEPLVYKQMGFMNNMLNKANLPNIDKSDYQSEAYITMIKALDSIDLSKVADDFGFYCRYNQYLSSQNRDMMKKKLKHAMATTTMYRGYGEEEYNVLDTDPSMLNQKSIEEQYEDSEKSRIIAKAISNVMCKSSPQIRTVLAGFRDGAKAAQVREDLDITSSEYNKLVRQLRSVLKEEVCTLQRSSNVSVF